MPPWVRRIFGLGLQLSPWKKRIPRAEKILHCLRTLLAIINVTVPIFPRRLPSLNLAQDAPGDWNLQLLLPAVTELCALRMVLPPLV